MTSYRHVTEIREHMVEIRKCCNVWPMFVRLKLGLKMLQPGSQNIVKYFQVSLMRCKWQIENSTWRIAQKFLYSPNRTNRSNRTSVFFPIKSS